MSATVAPAKRRRVPIDPFEQRRQRAMAKRLKKPKLDNDDRLRLLGKVEPLTCSEPWTAVAVKAADECGIDSTSPAKEIARRLGELGVYPPPAEHSLMVPCPAEQPLNEKRPARLYPAPYVRAEAHNLARGSRVPKTACEDCQEYFLWKGGQFLRSQGFSNGKWNLEEPRTITKSEASDTILRACTMDSSDSQPIQHDEVTAQLQGIGLTIGQSELLVLIARGYTQIDAAAALGKSQAWASGELSQALRTITQAGYSLKGSQLVPYEPSTPPQVYLTDPAILDRLPAA